MDMYIVIDKLEQRSEVVIIEADRIISGGSIASNNWRYANKGNNLSYHNYNNVKNMVT